MRYKVLIAVIGFFIMTMGNAHALGKYGGEGCPTCKKTAQFVTDFYPDYPPKKQKSFEYYTQDTDYDYGYGDSKPAKKNMVDYGGLDDYKTYVAATFWADSDPVYEKDKQNTSTGFATVTDYSYIDEFIPDSPKSKTAKNKLSDGSYNFDYVYIEPVEPVYEDVGGYIFDGFSFLNNKLFLLVLVALAVYLKAWELPLTGWKYGRSTYAEEYFTLEEKERNGEFVSKLDWIKALGRAFWTAGNATIGDTPLGQTRR